MRLFRSKRRILAAAVALAAFLLIASPAAAHRVKFKSRAITAVVVGRTGEAVNIRFTWKIACEGANRYSAFIGLAGADLELVGEAVKVAGPMQSGRGSGTRVIRYSIPPGNYLPFTASVRCVSTKREEPSFVGKHLAGSYSPKPGKPVVVR